MTAALLAVHVLAAVVMVGPITVAASTFPRYARAAGTPSADPVQRQAARASAAAMYQISRTYAVLSVAVPVFGIATAVALDVLTQSWVLVSMLLTVVAGLLLALAVVPLQRRVLGRVTAPTAEADPVSRSIARLAALTGTFNLIWVLVVVLMIVRPGSTTGVWR